MHFEAETLGIAELMFTTSSKSNSHLWMNLASGAFARPLP
jgi:hypothetical protein